MTTIDIFSGFLGAGKTTLIKKLISEAYQGEKLVLIENEFGEIGIDGGFMQDAGIEVTEMNSGCICCSLVGDFGAALQKVLSEYAPDRILIEPSGVGKLSDIVAAVQAVLSDQVQLGARTVVVDAAKCKMYMKNFGEFYQDQVSNATAILLSRTDNISQEKLDKCVQLLRAENTAAVLVTTPWSQLTGSQLRAAIDQKDTLAADMDALLHEHHDHCHDDHDHHDHDHCHDDHDHHDHGHCHDDHDHHDHDHCHDDHDHHDHGPDCTCGCHDHHHHHADEVFTSWGRETAQKYSEAEISSALRALDDAEKFGSVLRAKGILEDENGGWIHFDYVPGEANVRRGPAVVTGRICVIGAQLREPEIARLFRL